MLSNFWSHFCDSVNQIPDTKILDIMKKLILLVSTAFLLFSFNTLVGHVSSGIPPGGYNGEFGFYCNACHTSYGLNSGGGTVIATGLPAGGYIAGQSYPFSITISHGTADRTRWGFEIAARNSLGQPVGDFIPSASSYLISQAQLGHLGATFTAPADQYTYTGLTWTAPPTPTPDDVMVNFYMVGNSSNGNGFSDGDYIYSNTATITLPVRFGYFRAQVKDGYKTLLEWQTTQESNTAFFIIERSTDGLTFTKLDSVPAAGNSATARNYQYTDALPRVFDQNVFYRLKQTDRNGQFAYSAIERVIIKNTGTYIKNIVPNPVKWGEPFYAEIMSKTQQNAQVMLVNMKGEVVFSEYTRLQEGLNALLLNPARYLSAGHYFLSVQNEHFRQRISLVVR
jgi:hypothetical protein